MRSGHHAAAPASAPTRRQGSFPLVLVPPMLRYTTVYCRGEICLRCDAPIVGPHGVRIQLGPIITHAHDACARLVRLA